MYKNLLEMLDYTAYHYPNRKAFIYLKNGSSRVKAAPIMSCASVPRSLPRIFNF